METIGTLQRRILTNWHWLAMSLAILSGLYAMFFASDLGIRVIQENWLHEFFHDARHAAGFPCH
ncbi:MAG: CbtB-domain containing protein [Chloroflexi bacterium]|nr:CbtB-domain containing protein [Chloroflexota bacterium]